MDNESRYGISDEYGRSRSAYNTAKNLERLRIVRGLQEAGFTASGRQGVPGYTSRGCIAPCNLGLWKWVFAKKGRWIVVIDLQTLEQDPLTKAVHALEGVISVDVLPADEIAPGSWEIDDRYMRSVRVRYGVENLYDPPAFESMCTRFCLPLSDQDRAELIDEILLRIDRLEEAHGEDVEGRG